MAFPLFHYNANQEPPQEAPFTVFVEHRDKTCGGAWRPQAFVMLTPSLRTSGFLLAMPPEELQSFLLLLTFVTPNGDIAPCTWQLAEALGQSGFKTRARMERLLKTQWLGQQIITRRDAENGGSVYLPVHGLLQFREEEARASPESMQSIHQAVPRELIIERSRRLYARPRAEVETDINRFLSKSPLTPPAPTTKSTKPSKNPMPYQETTPRSTSQDEASNQAEKPVKDALLRAGLYPEQADELLAEYDNARIERQLAWLPYRRAHNPAGMLLAAIRGDYEAPPAMRHSRPASEPESSPPLDASALDDSHAE